MLNVFAFVYTDSDQAIMWGGLKDYAEGNFYEPRFYGQNYNTFLEALLAVPLYRQGFPAYMALPLVTCILSTFPFFLISFFTLIKRSFLAAYIILSIPLLLPPEYAMISSMPRGFVTGVFIASFGCVAVFYDTNKWWFFFSGLIAVLAYTVNSNATLLSIACILYLFMVNYKRFTFYMYFIAGMLPGVLLHGFFQYFYKTHPFYNTHGLSIDIQWDYFIEGLKMIDVFLNYNTPFLWQMGFMSLFFFVGVGIYFLWHKKFHKAVPLLVVPVIMLVVLSITKIHDGVNSVFFHQARMYLAVPVVFAFCLSLFEPAYEPKLLLLWIVIPYNYYTSFVSSFENTVKKRIQHSSVVIVSTTQMVLDDCERMMRMSKKNHVELFVVLTHHFAEAYTSGCAACFDEFPTTLEPTRERRTWRLLEDERKTYKTVMIINLNDDIDTSSIPLRKIPYYQNIYIVENNTLPTLQLLDKLHIKYRKFK